MSKKPFVVSAICIPHVVGHFVGESLTKRNTLNMKLNSREYRCLTYNAASDNRIAQPLHAN